MENSFCFAEVNLANYAHNLNMIRQNLADGVKIMAVIKANAYGCGIVEIAKKAWECGVFALGVARMDEALIVRNALKEARIVILGFTPKECIKSAIAHNIELCVYHKDIAQAISREAVAQGKVARIHIKIDTGMGRIGYLVGNLPLGMQFRTCENFGDFADSKSSLNPQNFSQAQKPYRNPQDLRARRSNQYLDCDSLHESSANQAQNHSSLEKQIADSHEAQDLSLQGNKKTEAIQMDSSDSYESQSWGFKGATPPCSKSPSARMGLSTSPSPCGRGLGGGVSKNKLNSQNPKDSHESQESKRFFASPQNDKMLDLRESQTPRESATDSVLNEVESIANLPNINLAGVFTHFSSADEADLSYTKMQYDNFCDFVQRLELRGIRGFIKHCANSAGIFSYPQSAFDMVRVGIISYGIAPIPLPRVDLRQVLSLKARIVHIKTLPKNSAVSYGRTFITTAPTKIATVCVGYADGYSRLLSNKGEVLIRGIRAKVVGSVCMDQLCVDISGISDAKIGDRVVLFGTDEWGNEISPNELAQKIGTISYEILCAVSNRVPRVYVC